MESDCFTLVLFSQIFKIKAFCVHSKPYGILTLIETWADFSPSNYQVNSEYFYNVAFKIDFLCSI